MILDEDVFLSRLILEFTIKSTEEDLLRKEIENLNVSLRHEIGLQGNDTIEFTEDALVYLAEEGRKTKRASYDDYEIDNAVDASKKLKLPTAEKSSEHRGNPNPRFSDNAKKVIYRWLDEHAENPYPNAVEKAALCSASGMSPEQLSTFLRNYRHSAKTFGEFKK